MNPLLQTRGDNCLQTCIASIFELLIEEVPEFTPCLWYGELNQWLQGMGLFAITFPSDGEVQEAARGFSLGGVKSKRLSGLEHCVVCYNGRIVWDPWESEERNGEIPEHYTVFGVINPARLGVKGGAT